MFHFAKRGTDMPVNSHTLTKIDHGNLQNIFFSIHGLLSNRSNPFVNSKGCLVEFV